MSEAMSEAMSEEGIPFCGCRDRGLGLLAEAVAAWRKRHLRWLLAGSVPAASESIFAAAVDEAFKSWQRVCGLTFSQTRNSSEADIVITAGRIDGQGSVLAWSELPNGSDRQLTQKYDTSERFVIALRPGQGQVDLLAVACHEIGHALGLDHANQNTPDLMAPYYKPGLREPQAGDIARIQRLYGPAVAPQPPQPPTPNPGPAPGVPDPIEIRIWGAERIVIPGYKVIRE